MGKLYFFWELLSHFSFLLYLPLCSRLCNLSVHLNLVSYQQWPLSCYILLRYFNTITHHFFFPIFPSSIFPPSGFPSFSPLSLKGSGGGVTSFLEVWSFSPPTSDIPAPLDCRKRKIEKQGNGEVRKRTWWEEELEEKQKPRIKRRRTKHEKRKKTSRKERSKYLETLEEETKL